MIGIPALALLRRFWPALLVGGCIIVLLIGGLYVQHVEAERDEARRRVAQQSAEIAALQVDASAKEQASIERANDTAKDAATQKETADALRTAADPGRALNCLRLKRAGVATPAACR